MNIIEKLTEVNNLMKSFGFGTYGESEIEEFASSFGTSEYDDYYWDNLCYSKDYPYSTLYVRLTTDGKLHLADKETKLYSNNLDTKKYWITSFISRDLPIDQEKLDKKYKGFLKETKQAEKLVKKVKRALNKISAYHEE